MKKSFDLKILEKADKKTVEMLSERYRAVNDKEGEKIFQKSIRKSSSEKVFSAENQVHGVDVYCRPKWHKVAQTTAAVLALTLGMISLFRISERLSRKAGLKVVFTT